MSLELNAQKQCATLCREQIYGIDMECQTQVICWEQIHGIDMECQTQVIWWEQIYSIDMECQTQVICWEQIYSIDMGSIDAIKIFYLNKPYWYKSTNKIITYKWTLYNAQICSLVNALIQNYFTFNGIIKICSTLNVLIQNLSHGQWNDSILFHIQ